MLELDAIAMIYEMRFSSNRNHTMVLMNDGEVFCSCRLHLPPMSKAEFQLIVGNVDA